VEKKEGGWEMGVVWEQEMKLKHKLPGYLATGLLTLATALWTFWGVGEMYYEGWWGQWTNRLPYLAPMVICWAFAFLALTWPRLGGWIILLVGGAFTVWRWILQARLGGLTLSWALGWFPISAVFILIGILFLLDGRNRRRQRAARWQPPSQWWRRNVHYLVVFIPSILIAFGVTILFTPLLSSRYDNGDVGAWHVAGNGVNLIWAPAGLGWSQGIGPSQEAGERMPGANLSWNEIAFYGAHPIGLGEKPDAQVRNATSADMQVTGLCRYLSADGSTLMAETQNIWRMPTTDEIVRSLVRRGENANCVWDGQSSSADCQVQPNKDAPLWNSDASPIYYYAGQEYDEESAWYVPYTGGGLYGGVIGAQPKNGGNPRHGFRCVREP
jgi:hypothetical protein